MRKKEMSRRITMEDKKQDVNSLEELVKIADSYKAFFASLADEISKVLTGIKAPKQEDTWEMKCPYKDGDEYYFVSANGLAKYDSWGGYVFENEAFDQGNIFPTKQAAELESKRRNLLTRFRAFRDECNGDWKADWNDVNEGKKYLYYSNLNGKIHVHVSRGYTDFNQFGYFKNRTDAERAIELFGQEIIELYVEDE